MKKAFLLACILTLAFYSCKKCVTCSIKRPGTGECATCTIQGFGTTICDTSLPAGITIDQIIEQSQTVGATCIKISAYPGKTGEEKICYTKNENISHNTAVTAQATLENAGYICK
ncbi:MAG: hypothetical protein V4615_06230 [Bacteroidota bacterium]